MRKILLHNSMQTYKVMFFHAFLQSKTANSSHAHSLYIRKAFFVQRTGIITLIINPPHKVDTNDKRKEKTAHISLFTEIIRIFAKVYY